MSKGALRLKPNRFFSPPWRAFAYFSHEGKVGRPGAKPCAYVVQNQELKQVYDTLDLVPRKPDYMFRLTLKASPAQRATLDLPATEEQMREVQQALGITGWKDVTITEADSALPGFVCSLDHDRSIEALNELAEKVRQLDEGGQLKKFKAILAATDCQSVGEAADLADNVDDYLLAPDIRNPSAAASSELRVILSENDAQFVMKHLDLQSYGEELMERQNAAITDYGLVERRDGQPLMAQRETQTQGMQMI